MANTNILALARELKEMGLTADQITAVLIANASGNDTSASTKTSSKKKSAPQKKEEDMVEWVCFNKATNAYDGETIMIRKKDLPYKEAQKEAHLRKINETAEEKAERKARNEARKLAFEDAWEVWRKSPKHKKSRNKEVAEIIRKALKDGKEINDSLF